MARRAEIEGRRERGGRGETHGPIRARPGRGGKGTSRPHASHRTPHRGGEASHTSTPNALRGLGNSGVSGTGLASSGETMVSSPLHPPVRHRVRGGSMSPTLVEGDEVLLSLAAGPVIPGEVVVARGPHGRLVLHRVVSAHPGAVITRGDACPHEDPQVRPSRVLLRATGLLRAGKVRPLPRPLPRSLRRLRSIARRCLASLRAAHGRWWTERPSSSTCSGGGSWA
jgi:hypothetical protein